MAILKGFKMSPHMTMLRHPLADLGSLELLNYEKLKWKMLGNGRKFGSAELFPLSESSALTVCQKVRPKFGRTESSVYH